MLPPKTLYSATVKNNTENPVRVVVHYRMEQDVTTTEETIAAGSEHLFPQRTKDNGTATFTFEISKIEVKGENEDNVLMETSAPFVDGPTQHAVFSVGAAEIAMQA